MSDVVRMARDKLKEVRSMLEEEDIDPAEFINAHLEGVAEGKEEEVDEALDSPPPKVALIISRMKRKA